MLLNRFAKFHHLLEYFGNVISLKNTFAFNTPRREHDATLSFWLPCDAIARFMKDIDILNIAVLEQLVRNDIRLVRAE